MFAEPTTWRSPRKRGDQRVLKGSTQAGSLWLRAFAERDFDSWSR